MFLPCWRNAQLGVPVEAADLAAAEGSFRMSTLKPEVVGATASGDTVIVNLTWDPPAVNVDARSTNVINLVGGYGIMEVRRTGTATETRTASDTDGSSTDTRATVTLLRAPAGSGAVANLHVLANLIGTTGAGPSVRGVASSDINLDPTLATSGPGKGRGKGLEKAPGQSR